MKKINTCLWLIWLFYQIGCTVATAQTPTQSTSAFCGITELTPQQAIALTKEANLALQKKRASGSVFTTITYVPIRPHIVRRSNGAGGFTLARLNQVMALTNSYYLYSGYGIQFYFAGTTPDYINDDYLYNNGILYSDGNADNAMNQYYVPFIQDGSGGYAAYPDNTISSTRSVISVASPDDDLGNRLIPHELGHNFSLIHTFGQIPGSGTQGSGITTELVTRGAGANCTTDGDLICDTPADPYNMSGVNLIYVNGCPQYDPNSTAHDANGEAFSPSLTNIMSYYFPCTHDFTPGQYDRMQAGLALRQTHTAYSLNAPPTAVTAPSNLTGSMVGGSVVLTWQDNANNEMGYFIERSTSPTTGFLQIGGVAPDITTFTDPRIITQTQYYYRLRPSNTTTGSLSSTFTIFVPTPPLVTGLSTTNITGNSAQLNWNNAGAGTLYTIQWRPVGNTIWSTISNVSNASYTLPNLSPLVTYEWQVKVMWGDTYSGPESFTTICPIPTNLSSNPQRSSATLSWQIAYPSGSFILQFRLQGSSSWTTLSNLTNTSAQLTGLATATAYEWQVQQTCTGSSTANSGFSSPQSFTTYACQTPTLNTPYSALSTSVVLNWYLNYYEPSPTTYDLQYRPIGSPTWTTVSSLTATSYSLTGLTNNTQYEYQVRSVCSPTESSDYSTAGTFTTSCAIPTGLFSTATATQATLFWFVAVVVEAGLIYELQYRPIGATNWNTINGLTTGNYSLTGLTTNVSYEWRTRSICQGGPSDYSSMSTFTTVCSVPTTGNLVAGNITSSTVDLFWSVTTEPGTLFDLQYRPVGSGTWTTLSSLTATQYSGSCQLTGLNNNTQYEWQIRTVCSPTESTSFTPGPTFTTQCQIPSSLYVTTQVTSAVLYWTLIGNNISFEVRYRQSGAADWTTLSNITTTLVSLTGLSPFSTYEWQVRTHCPDGVYSDFSILAYFNTPSCGLPTNLLTVNIHATSAQATWTFSAASADTRYEVRYRVVGTADWTTIGNLSSLNGSGLVIMSGLTSGSQYEWQVRTICSATTSTLFSNSVFFSLCPNMYTVKAGAWTDASVWSCNRVPDSTDIVQIKHIVTVPINYTANALQLNFDAGKQLSFNQNARLKIGP